MNNLKLKYKILLIPGIAAVGFVLLILINLILGTNNLSRLGDIEQGYIPALEWNRDLKQALESIQRRMQEAVAAAEEEGLDEADELKGAFSARLLEGKSIATVEVDQIETLNEDFDEYYRLARGVSVQMIGVDAGIETGEDFNSDLEAMTSKFRAIETRLEQGITSAESEMQNSFGTARDTIVTSTIVNVVMALIFVLVLSVFAFWIGSKYIAGPIETVTVLAERVAGGDLSGDVSVSEHVAERKDEVNILHNAFASMTLGLRNTIGKMQHAATELSSSVAQISTTAKETAASSEEQASTVVEVSSTAEEINQASVAAAETARSVVQAAETASQSSQQGLAAVSDVAEVMAVIQDRIQELAKKILHLSEQNVRIGEIVESVKDLADQSNLLAVNASIEAAKAGERGRGFAVVATEVRGLAEQSKQATQQIRSIVADVQKATSSAVMATEESSRKAEDGRKTVETLRVVVETLSGVLEDTASKARQIAGASQQQVAGISDITNAIQDLTRAARDSASGAKNLEGAIGELTSLGAQLQETTESYVV